MCIVEEHQEVEKKENSNNLNSIKNYHELKKEFASVYSEKFFLLNTYEQNLEAYYLSEIGLLLLDFQKKEYEVDFLERKINFMINTPNGAAYYNLAFVDEIIKKEMSDKEKLINDFEEVINKSNSRLVNLLSPEESEDVHKIFPELVEHIYPKLQFEQTDYLTDTWKEIVNFFKEGKINEIKKIHSTIDLTNNVNDLNNEQLEAEISRIEELITNLNKEITEIKSRFPFTLIPLFTDANLLADEVAKYSNSINQLTEKKYILENKFYNLTVLNDYGAINPN